MNRPPSAFFFPLRFFVLVLLAFAPAVAEEDKPEPEPPVLAFQGPDGTAVEGTLIKTVAFESIAGVLQVPGEKIRGITFAKDGKDGKDGETTLKLSDGSAISGKIAQKHLSFKLFIGEVDIPLEHVKAFGEKAEVHQPKVVEPEEEMFVYVVREGDTLASIASAFITTTQALHQVNPGLKKGNNLRVGSKIKIPPLE